MFQILELKYQNYIAGIITPFW